MILLINNNETQYQNSHWKDNITKTHKYDIISSINLTLYGGYNKYDGTRKRNPAKAISLQYRPRRKSKQKPRFTQNKKEDKFEFCKRRSRNIVWK